MRWAVRWLLPRDDAFFQLFEQAGAITVRAADALHELFSGPITTERFQALDDIEHEADSITHEMIARISRTFITPLDRDDIHRLIHVFDDIVDAAESAGELAVLCKVGDVEPEARELTRVLQEICRELAALLPALQNGQPNREHIVRAHELENEGDRLWAQAFANLFEGDRSALDVIKWKEIYEQLEVAIDACELAAQLIEEVAYKNA